ncbi:hypothetical protein [Laspinema palackyanum]
MNLCRCSQTEQVCFHWWRSHLWQGPKQTESDRGDRINGSGAPG